MQILKMAIFNRLNKMQFRGNGTISLSRENKENLCVNSTLSSNWQKREREKRILVIERMDGMVYTVQ